MTVVRSVNLVSERRSRLARRASWKRRRNRHKSTLKNRYNQFVTAREEITQLPWQHVTVKVFAWVAVLEVKIGPRPYFYKFCRKIAGFIRIASFLPQKLNRGRSPRGIQTSFNGQSRRRDRDRSGKVVWILQGAPKKLQLLVLSAVCAAIGVPCGDKVRIIRQVGFAIDALACGDGNQVISLMEKAKIYFSRAHTNARTQRRHDSNNCRRIQMLAHN